MLLQKIYEILDEHPENHNYGIDKILLALNQRGEYPSRFTVIRAMKKEKLYQLDTTRMTMEEVKTEVWRFVQYYNRIRICTFNEGGYPPVVYREKVAAGEIKAAA